MPELVALLRQARRRTVRAAGRVATIAGRVTTTAGRVAGHATTASIATPDLADRTAPGTLPPPRPAARLPRRLRPPGPVPVILVLIGLIVAGLGFQHVTGVPILPSGLTVGAVAPPRRFPVLPPSQPVDIEIQRLGVRTAVHPVGLAPDGSIAVPPPDRNDEAGWYDASPTPGEYGPAVIVGHVDTRTGPAVFHRLNQLRPRARIEISRQDGSVAVFEVNSVQRFAKERQPVGRIYDDFSRPGLRLMTCGGRWVGGSVGYADNVVVFASLVAVRSTN